ncbi:MAG: glycosyltransferase family 4 protein [bacterium]
MTKKRMHIVLVTNIFPPDIGGPATFIPMLGNALCEKGYPVRVVCTSDRRRYPDDSRFPFHLIRLERNKKHVIHELQVRTTLLAEMFRASAVFANGLEHYVSWVSLILRKPFVLKIAGDTVWETARNTGQTSMDIDAYQPTSKQPESLGIISARRYRYIRAASHIITPSDYLRKMVIGWGVAPERVEMIYNGVDGRSFSGAQIKRAQGCALQVAFIGRLTNWKGVDALLLAVRAVDGVHVRIIGDGPEGPILMDLSRRMGITERVTFTGRISRERLNEEFSRIHVVVLPSLYEGLSHTLLEAGARGIPCIASNKGGNPEVIDHGIQGFLIDPMNVEALQKHILWLRDNEKARQDMGIALQQRVQERFSLHRTVDMTVDALVSAYGIKQ